MYYCHDGAVGEIGGGRREESQAAVGWSRLGWVATEIHCTEEDGRRKTEDGRWKAERGIRIGGSEGQGRESEGAGSERAGRS